ncbi:MAG: murein biosynthesis integral membrane protein MurJ [Chloroflexota bacterium]
MKKLSFLGRTSLLVGFFFGLDKLLAFVRSIIIARQFRLSMELDAFNVANNLPDLLFALISGGALAMAFIPILTETLTLHGRPAAWNLFSRLANVGFLATASAALLVALFAEQIVRSQMGIAPGFGSGQQALVAELMRLNLAATLIFSISGLVMAGLQSNQHFLLPALAPALYNVGQITGALVFSPAEPYVIGPFALPAFGLGVHGLVYGVILGACLHLLIQVPGLIKYQFRWTASLDVRDPAMRDALRMAAPRLLTMFGIQMMFIARDNFASRLDQVGAVSSLTYGWMIMQVPETLIGTAIAVSMLPTLSELAARGDWEAFRAAIEKALRVLIALTLPVAAVMAAGLHPLVRAAFGFDAAGTALLTWTTRVFLLTLTGYAVQELMARAFYARKQPWFPFFGVLARMVLYLAVGLLAVTYFQAPGAPAIAAAELSLTVEAVLMLCWLARRLPGRLALWPSVWKGGLAALLGSGIAYALALYLPGGAVATALGGMLIGGLVALALVWKEARLLFRL